MGARPSSFVAPIAPPKPTRVWSPQQEAIFAWFEAKPIVWYDAEKVDQQMIEALMTTQPGTILPASPDAMGMVQQRKNLVVRARAGTGKTTTIIEGVDRAPEPSILVCAFNKGIAEELQSRVENNAVEVRTLHALGYQMIRRQWRGIPVASDRLRAESLTNMAVKVWEIERKEKVPYQIHRLVTTLHTKGREMVPIDPTAHDLSALAYRFDLVPDEGWRDYTLDWVVMHALSAMHYAATNEPTYDIGIDYADMLYLPLVWGLTARDWQLVVVDEAQDMTVAQLELCQRCCDGRFCIVGDDRQAIYGFRGADSGSLDRLKTELDAAELPLTVTYRCGKQIVELAQTLVPDIEPLSTAGDGVVDTLKYADMLREVRPGDFILSRINAPLVATTLRLLRHGTKATMRGRDLGQGVTNILKRLKCFDRTPLEEVVEKVAGWERKQVAKLAASGQVPLIAQVRDQAGILYALAEDVETTGDLLRKAQYLFSDTEGGDQVLCSSVHKAKGLEANRVFILKDSLYRFGVTPEEQNIEYVAITRAKAHLTWVTEVPGLVAPRLQP